MNLYRNILRQALITAWQSKYLWFFGLFAAIIGSGGFEVIGQSYTSNSDFALWLADMKGLNFFKLETLVNLKRLAITDPFNLGILVLVYLVILLLAAFVIWVATVSQVAIVNSTAMVIGKKSHDFQTSLKVGMEKFWPVLSLNIVIKLTIIIVLFLINLPILSNLVAGGSKAMSIGYFLSYVVFVPLLILFSFVIKFIISYIVIKNETLVMACKRSWQLFKENWIISIEMAFLLFFISFAITVVAILILSILYLPIAFFAAVALKTASVIGAMLVLLIGGTLAILALAFIGAFDATFQIAAWTGLFIELTGRGGESKLQRTFAKYLK